MFENVHLDLAHVKKKSVTLDCLQEFVAREDKFHQVFIQDLKLHNFSNQFFLTGTHIH